MHKRKYLLLTILIFGPTQPGLEMDFFGALNGGHKILWESGVQILDKHRKDSFTLRAIGFVTINDYPALFTLSRRFKGKVGCIVCIDGTAYMSLDASKKIGHMTHRRFLLKGQRYCLKRWICTSTIMMTYTLLHDQVIVKAKQFSK